MAQLHGDSWCPTEKLSCPFRGTNFLISSPITLECSHWKEQPVGCVKPLQLRMLYKLKRRIWEYRRK
jgi:hypothetical protein